MAGMYWGTRATPVAFDGYSGPGIPIAMYIPGESIEPLAVPIDWLSYALA